MEDTTTTQPARRTSSGRQARAETRQVVRLTDRLAAQSASLISPAVPVPGPPALATSTSMAPKWRRVTSATSAMSAADAASATATSARSPSSAAVSYNGSGRLPTRTTAAPSAANLRVTAAPMPVPAPVITATRPASQPAGQAGPAVT